MPKVKCVISDVIPLKKHKQNPIIGKWNNFQFIFNVTDNINSEFLIGLAHFQNGEISDEFAENLDICLAKDTQAADDGSPSVLLAISKNNVYDGRIGQGYPTDLKRKFLVVRKKDSEEVMKS